MSGWEQYFEKIVCDKNNGYNKDKYPYIYHCDSITNRYTKSPIIYVYRNKDAINLEFNLPMPPTNSFEYMFYNCESLSNIDGLRTWDTRKVICMDEMFCGCRSLKTFPFDLDELKSFTNKSKNDWNYVL